MTAPAPPRSVTVKLPPGIDKQFKGREHLIERLHAGLNRKTKGQPTIVALSGLGGIGKTRAAVEYARAHIDDYSALLFAPADSARSLRRNLATLSQELTQSQRDIPDENLRLQATLDWLRNRPGWLLILDGVNTQATLNAALTVTEQLAGGHLLITSRRKDFPPNVERLEVQLLGKEAAEEFLLERTSDRQFAEDDIELARQLSRELGWLPLALEHAGAYINTNHWGFARYLDLWRGSSHDLLSWTNRELTRYPCSIAKTLLISIKRLTAAGRHLLELLAFLAPAPVPVFVLDERVPGAESEDPLVALSDLSAYSLVSFDRANSQFSVHPLVQRVVLRDLHHRGHSQQRLAEALRWIDASFDGHPEDRRNWPRLEALWPHASTIANRATQTDSAMSLTNKLALLLTTKVRHARRDIELGITPRSWLPLMTELEFRHAKFERALEPLEGLTNLTELNLTGIYTGKAAWFARWVNLDQLDLGRTEVISLAPLAKLKALRKLDLRRTKVRDVGPIRGLKKLEYLSLAHTLVSDIEPLARLPDLVSLDLSDTRIKNIALLGASFKQESSLVTLNQFPNETTEFFGTNPSQRRRTETVSLERALRYLNLGGTNVRDVWALQEYANLCSLDLSNTKVADVTPLVHLGKLEELKLNGAGNVHDLSGLKKLTQLRYLDLSRTGVTEVSALSDLVNLHVLSLGGCAVLNVSSLARLVNLQVLNLGCTKITDLEALKGLANLFSLDLRGTRIHDVRPIAALLQLRGLDLAYTDVMDVTALVGLPRLETLHLEGTRVRDVPPPLASKVRQEF
jgi:Leucine-rich repeat (LRR) protein